jgi:hypothetical protein
MALPGSNPPAHEALGIENAPVYLDDVESGADFATRAAREIAGQMASGPSGSARSIAQPATRTGRPGGPLVTDACPNVSARGPGYGVSIYAAEPDYSAATRKECQWRRLPLP